MDLVTKIFLEIIFATFCNTSSLLETVTWRNSTSKIQSVIGHSCTNSKGDSGTQHWLLQKALHFSPMVVPDPAEKGGERHLFRKIKGVPCWVMTVFARELGRRVKRQPYPTTSPYLNPYFFPLSTMPAVGNQIKCVGLP